MTIYWKIKKSFRPILYPISWNCLQHELKEREDEGLWYEEMKVFLENIKMWGLFDVAVCIMAQIKIKVLMKEAQTGKRIKGQSLAGRRGAYE